MEFRVADPSIRLPERYQLASTPILGEGGMGRVLLARDVLLDVPVAIKLVRPDLARDPRFRKLFEGEVRTSARLTHAHIVPIHDYGELDDGTPYLGLDYADAGSFASFREAPPVWDEMLRLLLQLLDALAHLHARGVLHRDLKPENILLHTGADGRRHVWLADLGLANASSELARRKGRAEGTPGFMSPEQHRGDPREYGPWTDLFSLGVVIWEAVTGARPFPDLWLVPPPLPPLVSRMPVPAALGRVLANLLAAEPLSRYDLAADLRAELQALGPADTTGSLGVERSTVAEAAPSPDSGLGLGGTLYGFDPAILEALFADPGVATIPQWNRPLPPPMPVSPPTGTATGARARASLPLFALRELPLVAREAWAARLWEQARAVATDGAARVILLVGEAGSGKTSLVQSVIRALEEGGWAESVHLRYQQPAGRDDGYTGAARALVRPWNETADSLQERLVRQLSRERGSLDDRVRDEAASLVQWAGLGEGEGVPGGLGLREVYRHLEAREWRGLACVFVDDAHWAEEEGDGLAIAEAVLQGRLEGDRRRMLVIAAVRSEELAQRPGLADRVAGLVRSGALRLDLPRLDRDGTRALLGEALSLTPALAEQVAERCEGNPLFARQLLQDWAQRGWLVDTGGLVFALAPGVDADAALPADAASLFEARIGALARASGDPDAFRDTVHVAALAGRAVPAGLLLGQIAPDGLSAFVVGCGLWVEDAGGWTFDSTLLHQALRRQAEARTDLAQLHGGLVAAWTAWGKDAGVHVDLQVGRHAAAAGWWDRAVPALLRAAEAAAARGRTQELETASRLAFAAAGSAGDAIGQARARLWAARAAEAQGRPLDAEALFRQAQEALDPVDPVAGVEARLGLAAACRQRGDLTEAKRVLADVHERARVAGREGLAALGILGQAWVEQQLRNFEGAELLFTRAENRLTKVRDLRGAALATLGQAEAARWRGNLPDAEDLYGDAIVAFQDSSDPVGIARARIGRSRVHLAAGDADAASEDLKAAAAAAEELGATGTAMEARLGMADLARRTGDPERAGRLYDAQIEWAERQDLLEPAVLGCLGAGRLALAEGNVRRAHTFLSRAHDHLQRVPGHWLWAGYRLSVAQMLARRQDEKATFQWLWSASEVGLGDSVEIDTADALREIAAAAAGLGWASSVRLAGKLAIAQYERLGQDAVAREIQGWMPTP